MTYFLICQNNDNMKLAIGKFTTFGTTRALPGGKSHFLICEDKGPSGENGFVSVSLEYAQMAWDKSEEVSLEKLIHQVKDYLGEMGKTREGRLAIFTLIGQNEMGAYWGIYRQLTKLYGDPEEAYKSGLEYELQQEQQAHQKTSAQMKEIKEKHKEIQGQHLEIQEDIMSLKVDMDSLKQKIEALALREGSRDGSLAKR